MVAVQILRHRQRSQTPEQRVLYASACGPAQRLQLVWSDADQNRWTLPTDALAHAADATAHANADISADTSADTAHTADRGADAHAVCAQQQWCHPEEGCYFTVDW